MGMAALFPHLAGLRLARVELTPGEVILEAVSRARSAPCPACRRRSTHLHSRYTRRIADQPVGDRRVTIHLQVRRFRCRHAACRRATFAEQFPRLARRYARRSLPLQALFADIGLTIGGRPGARFAARRAAPVSRTTLLRLVRALPEPAAPPPAVLGVDDFALARGRRYGSVLVDLERRRPVDLLPDRTAASVATWLAAHGQPDIVCRDRGGEYASGARQGAPDAVQIADRFHLLQNVGAALERVVGRHGDALRAAVASEPDPPPSGRGAETAGAATVPPATAAVAAEQRRAARRARYGRVVALAAQGWSVSAISREVGLTRLTVRKFLRAGAFPDRAPTPRRLHDATPEAAYLRERWAAGHWNAAELWRDLRARGFPGSPGMVRRHVAGWRRAPRRRGRTGPRAAGLPRAARPRPPTPRQVRWWLLRPAADLEPDQRAYLERVQAGCPAIGRAQTLATDFGRLVRQRVRPALAAWLAAAAASGLPEFREVAAGMRRDRAAIEAALTHEWSSGQVEGQVTRIKLIKRQTYGRAKFDLLRKRVLLAS
jgi:transposase